MDLSERHQYTQHIPNCTLLMLCDAQHSMQLPGPAHGFKVDLWRTAWAVHIPRSVLWSAWSKKIIWVISGLASVHHSAVYRSRLIRRPLKYEWCSLPRFICFQLIQEGPSTTSAGLSCWRGVLTSRKSSALNFSIPSHSTSAALSS